MDLLKHIRNVPDFPKKGIQFKDITTLAKNPEAFKYACDQLVEKFKDIQVDKVCAIEARGYVFGSVIAYLMDAGFILIRKPGKLPANTIQQSYNLEYGTAVIEVHNDAFSKGDKVLVIDDLLATGGTAEAACRLVEKLGGEVVGIGFVIELTGTLHGRDDLKDYNVISLLEIPVEEE
ncbi:MAG: adenine phosphoribosyltransferase [Candidatus Lokiarchaeota archaeon]|nr:adenine phosphoribosyltransferase [Candidatus Lokiarchaeota archaeon]